MNFKRYIRAGKGASDITPLLLDSKAFTNLIDNIAELFKETEIDKVACIEGRGFILGSALAYKLQVGLVPLRQKGKLKNKVHSTSFKDYTGKQKVLEMHTDAIGKGDRVLIVDDWVETGRNIMAAIYLIEKVKGNIVGVGSFIDDSDDGVKKQLQKYNYKYIDIVLPEDNF